MGQKINYFNRGVEIIMEYTIKPKYSQFEALQLTYVNIARINNALKGEKAYQGIQNSPNGMFCQFIHNRKVYTVCEGQYIIITDSGYFVMDKKDFNELFKEVA